MTAAAMQQMFTHQYDAAVLHSITASVAVPGQLGIILGFSLN